MRIGIDANIISGERHETHSQSYFSPPHLPDSIMLLASVFIDDTGKYDSSYKDSIRD